MIWVLSFSNLFAQRHGIGLKAGVVDIDAALQLGPSVELGYDYQLVKGIPVLKRLHFQFNIGGGWQSTYPDFWRDSEEHVNGVPIEINERLLNSDRSAGFHIAEESYALYYAQAQLSWYLIGFGRWEFGVNGGIMLLKTQASKFRLQSWRSDPVTGIITDYTPRYEITNHAGLARSFGLGLRYHIGDHLVSELDFKFNQLEDLNEGAAPFSSLRVGLAYKFGKTDNVTDG